MYAVLKQYAVDYVIFEGTSYPDYPDWFMDKVLHYVVKNEYGCSILMNSPVDIYPEEHYEQELMLVEEWDVFVLNRQGDVRRIEYETFYKHYEEIAENVAALNRDAIRYTIYEGYGDIVPEHFGVSAGQPQIIDHMVEAMNDMGQDLLGSYAVVILLNNRNETKYLSIEDFNNHYISTDFPDRNRLLTKREKMGDDVEDIIDVPYHIDSAEDLTGDPDYDQLPW